MKRLLFFATFAVLLFSCSPNEETVIENINETSNTIESASDVIVEYHTLSPSDGSINAKYYFDQDNRFVKYRITSNNFTTQYTYDAGNKVNQIITKDLNDNVLETFDVLYDENDKIHYIGDRRFKYNPTGNFYDELSSYQSVGPFNNGSQEEFQYSYNRYYFQNTGNPIPAYCFMEGSLLTSPQDGTITDTGVCNDEWTVTYENNNVTALSQNNISSTFEYDTNVNPFYETTTNFSYVLGFLNNETSAAELVKLFIISANNNTEVHLNNSGNEMANFTYTINSFGFPVNATAQVYVNGSFEYEYLAANYYYEGDIIPD